MHTNTPNSICQNTFTQKSQEKKCDKGILSSDQKTSFFMLNV